MERWSSSASVGARRSTTHRLTMVSTRFPRDHQREDGLHGRIAGNLFWEAGYQFNAFRISDYQPKNEDSGISLLSLYRSWGIIPSKERFSEYSSALRLVLFYDSRDFEGFRQKVSLPGRESQPLRSSLAPRSSILQMIATLRQYIPLAKDCLTLAYRLDYLDYFADAPWYVLPFYTPGGPLYDNSALRRLQDSPWLVVQ